MGFLLCAKYDIQPESRITLWQLASGELRVEGRKPKGKDEQKGKGEQKDEVQGRVNSIYFSGSADRDLEGNGAQVEHKGEQKYEATHTSRAPLIVI